MDSTRFEKEGTEEEIRSLIVEAKKEASRILNKSKLEQ